MPSKKTSQENMKKARAKVQNLIRKAKKIEKEEQKKVVVHDSEDELVYSSESESESEQEEVVYQYVDQSGSESESDSESEPEEKPKKPVKKTTRGSRPVKLSQEERVLLAEKRLENKKLKKEALEAKKTQRRKEKEDRLTNRMKELLAEQLSSHLENFGKTLSLNQMKQQQSGSMGRVIAKVNQ